MRPTSKSRNTKAIAVTGEGITEKYYIESIKGLSPFSLEPQELGIKASSLKELEKIINKCIDKGFDKVLCLIDMDTKIEGKSKTEYQALKNKYHKKKFVKTKKGIQCEIEFFETHLCLELWFLYYFKYTTAFHQNYNELQSKLHKFCPRYTKCEKFFKSTGGLHKYLIKSGGNIDLARKNGKQSVLENKTYTYSQLDDFFHIILSKEDGNS